MKAREYLLNADGLDQIAAVLQEVLSDQGLERREALRIRLTMEELLLRVMEAQGEDPVTVTLSMKKRFGTQTILLRYGGPSFDPTRAGEENNWGDRLLQSLGLDPVWRWQGGENRVQLQVAPPAEGRPASLDPAGAGCRAGDYCADRHLAGIQHRVPDLVHPEFLQ